MCHGRGLGGVCDHIKYLIHQRKASEEGIGGDSAERAWGGHYMLLCIYITLYSSWYNYIIALCLVIIVMFCC